jgi:hypothetical protein
MHRDELLEITNRWFSNKLEPDDPLRITRIITYDSFAAWAKLLDFMKDLNNKLFPMTVHQKPVTIKKELKDFICNGTLPKSDRINQLISKYKYLPEYYYVGSPLAGHLYHDDKQQVVSMCRLKRVKRIAEKTSRYAALHINDKIREMADNIWREEGGNPDNYVPLPKDILARAEKRLMLSIKNTGLILPTDIVTIKDVLGVKVIQNGVSESKLESVIDRFSGAAIIEKEIHTGNYNAIHYVIELKVDIQDIILKFKSRHKQAMFSNRGLPEDRLLEDFEAFVGTGSDTVQLDLIFTTFDELIESEIGRSMHEARIFKQRQHQSSFGNIPTNIEYLIEYLIAVGLSPAVHIDEIPIKIWGRYLPDTLSHRIRSLYNMPGYSIIHP